MFRSFAYRLSALVLLLTLVGGTARAAQQVIMEEKDLLPYLEKMIAWRHAAASLDISPEIPREAVIKTALLQHTSQALDGSFAFAHAQADILPVTANTDADVKDKLDQASREVTLKRAIHLSEHEIGELQAALGKTKIRKDRDSLNGQIKLEQEHLTLLKAIAETIGVPDPEDDGLPHKIDQLAGTVATADQQSPKMADSKAPEGEAAAAQAPVASGIVGLATKIYFFYQQRSIVKTLLNDTTTLANDNSARGQKIRETVKDILQQGKELGESKTAVKPQPAKTAQAVTAAVKAVTAVVQSAAAIVQPTSAPPATYDQLVTQMKQMSKAAIALSQTNKALKLCVHDLSDWTDLISLHIQELVGNLMFRLSMLGLAITVAFALSMIARKATRRYVHDRRRKDQLRVVRKVTLAITILLILFLGFFTDLNSLATFAGLVTAGIAFAMKDMILSVIAYFQFFASSDIRPGDSITIAGVTGRITTIGMLRFYMMEMERSDAGFLPTGRVVGFANNILFQPTPFFRQTPGTNFVWNEIDISLAPNIDHDLAYKKLNEIVQKIYAKHQGVIQTSEQALQKFAPFKLDVSVPQTHFKFTNMGIVFVIRYAVEREQAQALHLQMTTELIAAARKDPDLKILHIS